MTPGEKLGLTISLVGWVVRVGEEGVVGHNVILQQRLEVFLAVAAEQERIDVRTEFRKGQIRRRKEGAT